MSVTFKRIAMMTSMIALAACAARSTQPVESLPTPSQNILEVSTFDQKTVVGAAERTFGQGTQGVAKVIERIFGDLGRPNGYIVGREASAAFVGGIRYGDGILYHKIEGEKKVYWTGPSVGFDIGGDASRSFTLVYRLNDTNDIFKRFPAVEGKVYFIGGFSVNYHQNGNIILAPVHLGAGWRLGINVGYLHYTRERTVLPF